MDNGNTIKAFTELTWMKFRYMILLLNSRDKEHKGQKSKKLTKSRMAKTQDQRYKEGLGKKLKLKCQRQLNKGKRRLVQKNNQNEAKKPNVCACT